MPLAWRACLSRTTFKKDTEQSGSSFLPLLCKFNLCILGWSWTLRSQLVAWLVLETAALHETWVGSQWSCQTIKTLKDILATFSRPCLCGAWIFANNGKTDTTIWCDYVWQYPVLWINDSLCQSSINLRLAIQK